MFKIVKRNEKGFTLIELMIVIAIIGILAAIAIPQFAQYRTRGYNSSAQSDVKNLGTSEATFFSDWQVFGVTAYGPAAVAGQGLGGVITGPGAVAAPCSISGADNNLPATNHILTIGLGNNVSIVANTDATNSCFTAASKHIQGDTYYALDSDTSSVYQAQDQAAGKGQILLPGDCPGSTSNVDDILLGPATAGVSAIAYAAK